MPQSLFLTALLVADYDEAIAFYRDRLGFVLHHDDRLSADKRWVVMAPAGGSGGAILLARPETDAHAQRARIGDQTAGRVFLFLDTDDFAREHAAYCAAGVVFVEPPRVEPYGIVAVFEDLYGNRWDLIQHAEGFAPAHLHA